jgi:hypothetical protein
MKRAGAPAVDAAMEKWAADLACLQECIQRLVEGTRELKAFRFKDAAQLPESAESVAGYCDTKAASPGATAACAITISDNEDDDIAVVHVAPSAISRFSTSRVSPAARCVHPFPYKFLMVNFDLAALEDVPQHKESALRDEWLRLQQCSELQYADDYYDAACPSACTKGRLAPNIVEKRNYISDITVVWFFQSMATLFPGVMILSPLLVHLKSNRDAGDPKYAIFLQNVKDRRPRFVLHPVNAPSDTIILTDPGVHWILFIIEFSWTQDSVSSSILVVDPFSNVEYVRPVVAWYQEKGWFDSFNPTFDVEGTDSVRPIQRGSGNNHCGCFIMALALNAVVGTRHRMHELEYFQDPDTTTAGGLELRKYVAWDCSQYPPLLDTCLLMCPLFTPIRDRRRAVQANQWWAVSQYHNIADALTLRGYPGGVFMAVASRKPGQSSYMAHVFTDSSRVEKGRICSDGPWFFKNTEYLVKVHCIGLIEPVFVDDTAVKRAGDAFQEACATQYVCTKEGWLCETFGLVCVGLVCPCAFVCIVRKLDGALHNMSASDAGVSLHGLVARHKLVLGEPHRDNLMLVDQSLEAINLARSFLVDAPPPYFSSWWYAACIEDNGTDHGHLREFMPQIESGLDATHKYFSDFYTGGNFLDQAFTAELFQQSPAKCWEYNPFLHLYALLEDANMSPKLGPEHAIHCVTGAIRWKKSGSSIEVSVGDRGSWLSLSSSSDTQSFFEKFSNPRGYSFHFFVNTVIDFSDEDGSIEDDQRGKMVSKRERGDSLVTGARGAKGNTSHRGRVCPPYYWLIKDNRILSKHVLSDICQSMSTRYGYVPDKLRNYAVPDFSEPDTILRPQHFGCVTVIVDNAAAQAECIQFIRGGDSFSIDTESPTPKFDNESISLIQIGTTLKVFLIRVCQNDPFLKELGIALQTKTLLCWDKSDQDKMTRATGCTFKPFDNVQLHFSSGSQLEGIDTSVHHHLVENMYTLSKVWTLSGWSFPLTWQQANYATLDVVCLHALYMVRANQAGTVFHRPDKLLDYHTFMHPSLKGRNHGFCYTKEWLGHFDTGVLTRGLGFVNSSFHIVGFRAGSPPPEEECDVVANFVQLLQDSKFCCACCSRFARPFLGRKFVQSSFKVQENAFLRTIPASSILYRVDKVSRDKPLQDAYLCFNMLLSFFEKPLNPACQASLADLLQSVKADIYYGYIHSTLGHVP